MTQSSVQFSSTIGLGSVVSIVLILAFIGGVVTGAYRLMRKIDRITDLTQTAEKMDVTLDDIRKQLTVIGEQSRMWRETSKEWHEEHLRRDHGVEGRQRGYGRSTLEP